MELIRRRESLKEITLWQEREIIKVVTGVRRSGKSTLFALFIEQLKSSGVADSQIISINFDDMKFEELKDYIKLVDYIKKRTDLDKWNYLFLDEVQECSSYEKAVSTFLLKKNIDIYLTGSNAYMFSSELATKLSARYIQINMLPLSFAEYSEAVCIQDKGERFDRYVNFGAFPYAACFIDSVHTNSQYFEGIYNTVIMKDIVERRNIIDVTLVKSVVAFLASSIGSFISTKKISDTLTSGGRSTKMVEVEVCVEALTDSYLFYKVNRYDIKGKMYLQTECKYYICDTGLCNYILGTQGKNIGHQIENIVYLELLRRGYRVNIGKSGHNTEVDFVAVRDNQTEYYQVSASVLDENTLKRELEPLECINDNYPKFILTLDAFFVDHAGIKQLNLIDWLLNLNSS